MTRRTLAKMIHAVIWAVSRKENLNLAGVWAVVTTATINLLPQLNFLQTVKYKELKMQQKLVRSFQHLNRSSLSLTTNRDLKHLSTNLP